ncbi:zinc-binding dehydrogenase [Micromonospora fulviviridis]|uniref:zinc-binding dehydrogenase n=1 Tax=Micromonospora fulviviridis TaxID=47860 RepID=UPI00379E0BB4
MKAIAIDAYGGVDRLTLRELPTPPVGPDTVLVRVRTVGVNPVDGKIREGHLAALMPNHFPLVPGWDAAGVVEAVGPAVAGFAVGDEVIGYVRRDDDGLLDRVRAVAPDGVDVALDLFGGDALDVSAELLARPARLVSTADPEHVTRLGGSYVFVKPSTADLGVLAGLVDAGRLAVHVTRTFPLAEAAEAQRLVAAGHVRGKVVLEV